MAAYNPTAQEYLVVSLASEGGKPTPFAIPLTEVREVLMMQEIHFVPGSKHKAVLGMSMIRSEPALVVELGQFYGLASVRERESAVMVISTLSQGVQAFVVGGVVGIVKAGPEDIQSPGLALNGEPCQVITLPELLAPVISLAGVLKQLGDSTVLDG